MYRVTNFCLMSDERMLVNHNIRRHKMSRNKTKTNSKDEKRRWCSNSERWSFTLKYGFREACCHAGPDMNPQASLILSNKVGRFDSWVDRQALFSSVGKMRVTARKTHPFLTPNVGTNTIHHRLLKLRRRLSDEKINRPENTNQDEAEKKK